MKVKQKVAEKPDLQEENIELRIQQYRCSTCAPLTKKWKKHKEPGACFEDNPKSVKNKLRNKLKSLCLEAKTKRLAEEAEAAKLKAKNVSENDDIEDEEGDVEKLMESFNKSLEKEDLDEQWNIAGELHFEVKKVAEKKVQKMEMNNSEELVPGTNPVSNLDTIEKPKNLEEIGEELEKSLENIEKGLENSLEKLSEGGSNAVPKDSTENNSVNDNLDDWCVGGVVNDDWVPCGKPRCKNCRI